MEGKLGSVATPRTPEETVYSSNQGVAFTAGTEQAVNNAWYDQRHTTFRILRPADRPQLSRSHCATTALLSRRRCYGRHTTMQLAGFPILSQPRTTANMEGRCWSEEKSRNYRRVRRMRLRNSSCTGTAEQTPSVHGSSNAARKKAQHKRTGTRR